MESHYSPAFVLLFAPLPRMNRHATDRNHVRYFYWSSQELYDLSRSLERLFFSNVFNRWFSVIKTQIIWLRIVLRKELVSPPLAKKMLRCSRERSRHRLGLRFHLGAIIYKIRCYRQQTRWTNQNLLTIVRLDQRKLNLKNSLVVNSPNSPKFTQIL